MVYTDDFGHYTKHSILPIGVAAKLDADKQELRFFYDLIHDGDIVNFREQDLLARKHAEMEK